MSNVLCIRLFKNLICIPAYKKTVGGKKKSPYVQNSATAL